MTDLHKAAMQQALEALENITDGHVCQASHHAKKDQHDYYAPCPIYQRHEAAITALREALAAPQPDSTAIHSCSYYCDPPDCIKAQRDELREALAKPADSGCAFPMCHNKDYQEAVAAQVMAELYTGIVVPPGYALVPVEPTPEMLAAYLTANKAYWERADQIVPPPDKWRNGTPTKATAESYRAMLAARPEALK